MSKAQDTVISAPELLELTLAQPPMRDLLVTVPLVRKTWQAVTLTPTLQRALFFQSDPSSPPVQNYFLGLPYGPSSIKSMRWAKAPDAFKREEASWRRILDDHPATCAGGDHHRYSGRLWRKFRTHMLDDPSLRMGVLYDLVVPYIDHYPASFRIRWHTW
ncbi:hypothetical protein B0H14DRAFT_2558896 [Mycena olivaceomarginata]|nr:hypothetical protein B0H14DRAFT_2558896 [Mycena olivaceomarginata]